MNVKPVQTAIRNKISQRIFSGCSIIFGKPNQKLLEIHEGNISFNNSKKINSETCFDLQSITKAVATGPLALKLIESGKIKLDDVIDQWHFEMQTGPEIRALDFTESE